MKTDRFEGIQIARAIAALVVCYFHSWGTLGRFPEKTAYPLPFLSTHGNLGVDLFFAISGFVICLVASRTGFNVPSFIIRRTFRLYPLWWATLSAFALVGWRFPGLVPTYSKGYFLCSMTLLPTYDLPFYDVGWSLQHEMMFYLVAAAIVPFAGIVGLALTLGTLAVANHVIELPWYVSHLATYYSEFLAGTLAFISAPYLKRLSGSIPLAIGVVSAGVFLYGSGGLSMLPIALYFLILGFANVRISATPASQLFVKLGDASYSIYLIHPVIFAIVRAITIKCYAWLPLWAEEPIRFASIGIVILVSLGTWHYFEMPILTFGNRLASIVSRPVLAVTDQKAI